MMSITELKVGEEGRIVALDQLDLQLQRRLADMGLCRGEVVKVQQKLPFAGPCLLGCCGVTVGLRYDDAAKIQVQVE